MLVWQRVNRMKYTIQKISIHLASRHRAAKNVGPTRSDTKNSLVAVTSSRKECWRVLLFGGLQIIWLVNTSWKSNVWHTDTSIYSLSQACYPRIRCFFLVCRKLEFAAVGHWRWYHLQGSFLGTDSQRWKVLKSNLLLVFWGFFQQNTTH